MAKYKIKLRSIAIAAGAIVLIGAVLAGLRLYGQIRPAVPGAKPHYIRLDSPVPLNLELTALQKSGDLKSASAALFLSRFTGNPAQVSVGSYEVGPGMSARTILSHLKKPIRRMLRIPETNWSNRTARLLQKNDVCPAQDYMACVHDPALFQSLVTVPLPKDSLEGYLFPDTYDLPPLLGAKRTAELQLKAFQAKVVNKYPQVTDWHRTLTIASLIELEGDTDKNRALISSVIQNRIKKGMPLQLDASLLYAIDKWRRLTVKDYKTIPGPYNLYRHKGLPPGPICSPSVNSIEAALHPANANYLYYVSLPDGRTLFASTYKEHLRNVAVEHQQLKIRDAAAGGLR